MKVENVKRFYVDVVIIFVLMFGFGKIPPIAPITELGMQILGIFISLIYAWSRGSLIWPSVVGLIAYSFTGENTLTAVFSSAFGNQTLLMTVWCMLFAATVEKCGLLSIISEFVLTKNFVKKSPWLLALGFFITSVLAGMFVGNPAATIFLWVIFWDVSKKLGLAPKSPYVVILMVGIVVLTYTGNTIMPYNVFLQIGIGVMTAVDSEFIMNYASYCMMALAINILLVPMLTLAAKLTCPKFEYEQIDSVIDATGTKLNMQQKIVLVVLACVIALLVIPNFLPTGPVKAFLGSFGVIGSMAIGAVVLMLIIVDGASIGHIGEAMSKNISWDMYFMLAAALTVSSGITADGTGVTDMLRTVFGPVLADKSTFIFLVMLIFIGVVLTNIMNNIVTYTLLIPLSVTFAGAYDVPHELLVGIFAIILLQGVVLPSGSVMGAMLHGSTEWVTPGLLYKYTIIAEVILALCVVAIGVPVGLILF